jgi:hypothetical protein
LAGEVALGIAGEAWLETGAGCGVVRTLISWRVAAMPARHPAPALRAQAMKACIR